MHDPIEVLKEVRQRLLIDIDDKGEPKSSMSELIKMWDNVNNILKYNNAL